MKRFLLSSVVALVTLSLLEATDGEPLHRRAATEFQQSIHAPVENVHLPESTSVSTSVVRGRTASRRLATQTSFTCGSPNAFITEVYGRAYAVLYAFLRFSCSDGTSVDMNIGINDANSGDNQDNFEQGSTIGFCGLFIGSYPRDYATGLKLIVCDGSTPQTWGIEQEEVLHNCPNGQIMVGLQADDGGAAGDVPEFHVLPGTVAPICQTLKFTCANSYFITTVYVKSGAGLDGIDSFTCSDGTTVDVKIGGTGGSSPTAITTTTAFCGLNVGTWDQYSTAAAGLSFNICGGGQSAIFGNNYLQLSSFGCSTGFLVGIYAGTTMKDGKYFVAQGSMAPVCGTLQAGKLSLFKCRGFNAFITSVNLHSGAVLDQLQSFTCSDGTSVNMNVGGSGGGSPPSPPINNSGFCGLNVGTGTTFLYGAASGVSFIGCNGETTQVYGIYYTDVNALNCAYGKRLVGLQAGPTSTFVSSVMVHASIYPDCEYIRQKFKCTNSYITSVTVKSGEYLDSIESFTCSDGATVDVKIGSGGTASVATTATAFCGFNVGIYSGYPPNVAAGLSFNICGGGQTAVSGSNYQDVRARDCSSGVLVGLYIGISGDSQHEYVAPGTMAPICESAYLTPLPTTNPTSPPTTSPTTNPTPFPTTNRPSLPTIPPTAFPTTNPTLLPTKAPTTNPTSLPTTNPTSPPTTSPTTNPTPFPTMNPTSLPTIPPTTLPTTNPTLPPTPSPTTNPTSLPTTTPTSPPTTASTTPPTPTPTRNPTSPPTPSPTTNPTTLPTTNPTSLPTTQPTLPPTTSPTSKSTSLPTTKPTLAPTISLTTKSTFLPTTKPTLPPTTSPATNPTSLPTAKPTSTTTNPLPTTNATKPPTPVPTKNPTRPPTLPPTKFPTVPPTKPPTPLPTNDATESPTASPTNPPTPQPTTKPTRKRRTLPPTEFPRALPTNPPTSFPTNDPTEEPKASPTQPPTALPTAKPTKKRGTRPPTQFPTVPPTKPPRALPTNPPTSFPTNDPTEVPTVSPTQPPTALPTVRPTKKRRTRPPTRFPTVPPTKPPTLLPTNDPTESPTVSPTNPPTPQPTTKPTRKRRTQAPTKLPTSPPT